MKNIATELLLVDQRFQGNFALDGSGLVIRRGHNFDGLRVTTSLLATINNADEQHGNHEDGAQNDCDFHASWLTLEPRGKP